MLQKFHRAVQITDGKNSFEGLFNQTTLGLIINESVGRETFRPSCLPSMT